jgi:hypothetical protein
MTLLGITWPGIITTLFSCRAFSEEYRIYRPHFLLRGSFLKILSSPRHFSAVFLPALR